MLQDGDFAAGLPFAATVLADVAIEAGELDEALALLALLPQEGWSPGVGTVLIPAARGRLRLAQGRPSEALADFQVCAAMFSSDIWGTEMRDVGYLHARAGAAQALIRLGNRDHARKLAEAELSDVRLFGAPRALGIALPAGIEAMTPSELRIVRLAVDGRSNRDIVRELYVTVKTVEGHLSRAY